MFLTQSILLFQLKRCIFQRCVSSFQIHFYLRFGVIFSFCQFFYENSLFDALLGQDKRELSLEWRFCFLFVFSKVCNSIEYIFPSVRLHFPIFQCTIVLLQVNYREFRFCALAPTHHWLTNFQLGKRCSTLSLRGKDQPAWKNMFHYSVLAISPAFLWTTESIDEPLPSSFFLLQDDTVSF